MQLIDINLLAYLFVWDQNKLEINNVKFYFMMVNLFTNNPPVSIN